MRGEFMNRTTRNTIAFLLAVAGALVADQIWLANLTPAVTSVASGTLNTTDGTAQKLLFAQAPCRIYVSAKGTASTTTGELAVYFKTAADTNYWDSPALSSTIKVVVPAMGTSTYTCSDWFQTAGAEYIKVGAISNSCNGAVSAIAIRISAPRD
jgi:hypothetical protein